MFDQTSNGFAVLPAMGYADGASFSKRLVPMTLPCLLSSNRTLSSKGLVGIVCFHWMGPCRQRDWCSWLGRVLALAC